MQKNKLVSEGHLVYMRWPNPGIVAIQFNQDECYKVNRTAPGFVGCSPLSISLSNPPPNSGNPTTLSTQTTQTTQTTSSNSLVYTISGRVVTEPPTFSGATIAASFGGAPLLTGTCSSPYYALVTSAAGLGQVQFPAVGCGPDHQGCCPFPYGSNARLSRCPQDYFTTSGGCCPV
jgi:hypothetical protein